MSSHPCPIVTLGSNTEDALPIGRCTLDDLVEDFCEGNSTVTSSESKLQANKPALTFCLPDTHFLYGENHLHVLHPDTSL